MSKSRGQHRRARRGARRGRPRRAAHVLRRRPLPPADRLHARAARRGAAARVERFREAGRRVTDGDSPEDLAPLRDAFFDALADDFNTPAALAAPVRLDPRGQPARRAGGRRAPARDARGARRSTTCSTRAEGPPRGARRARASGARRPARERDFAEADRLRDEMRAAGWEVRDGPDGPGARARWRDRLRPQPRARGAARAAPRARGSGRHEGRRAGGLAARRAVSARRADEIAARCGLRRPPGRLRRGRGLPATPTPPGCSRAPDPLLVALDEVTDPQNLGAVCRTAEVAGATGS